MILSKNQELSIYTLGFYFAITALGESGSYVQAALAYFLSVGDALLIVSYLETKADD